MKSYEYGRQSFFKGKLNSPYKDSTYAFKEWLRGFNRGYFENLEKVKQDEHRRGSKGTHERTRGSK